MSSPTFVLFGSGPGIGLAVAKAFSQKHFNNIVLCARDAERLASEKSEVEAAAKENGYLLQVHTFPVDLTDLDALRKTLKEIEQLGPLGCIYHNAARIHMAEALTAPVEEIEEDLKTSVLSLYTISQWAIPLLRKSTHPSPSFLATSSHLPESPMSILLSLSLAKAAQQNLIFSLHEAFGKEIHFGVLKVCGQVAKENMRLNPTEIAKVALGFYEQGREEWGVSVVIAEDN